MSYYEGYHQRKRKRTALPAFRFCNKARPKGVADGQQVEIPVLRHDRNVGTHVESAGRERRDRYKRRKRREGKSALQSKAVTWSERE